ncbi:hypothetical protein [Sulfitobacter sp. 1A15299]|uniref:hypothetical protein n=1 Tax=Sulfitobacter sp. 1A15299 TaxID=3368598 RepID=UPI003745BA8B
MTNSGLAVAECQGFKTPAKWPAEVSCCREIENLALNDIAVRMLVGDRDEKIKETVRLEANLLNTQIQNIKRDEARGFLALRIADEIKHD